MIISGSKLVGVAVLSLHVGGPIARITEPIIDPNGLKVVAFRVAGPEVGGENGDILEVRSVREFASMGMIIDSADELVRRGDVIALDEVLGLNFHLERMKAVTRKGRNLGRVIDYTFDPGSFQIMQIIVKRPALKGFLDPELTIGRTQIKEVTDDRIILKEESEKSLKQASNKEFVPNFVNPFRQEPSFARVRSQNPDEEDTE